MRGEARSWTGWGLPVPGVVTVPVPQGAASYSSVQGKMSVPEPSCALLSLAARAGLGSPRPCHFV